MAFDGSPVETWYRVAPVDPEGMRAVLDPEVEFHVCEGWPNGGTYRGHKEVLEDFFPAAGKAWESVKLELDGVIESGDDYVVRGRYVGVAVPTRIPFSVEFVHFWKVRDGLLVWLRQIADTAVLADARAGRVGAGASDA